MMMRKLFISGLAMLAATALCFDAGPLLAIVGAEKMPADAYLVAWYKLDGNALDSSGNGYNGTVTGVEAYQDGIYGQALTVSNSYMTGSCCIGATNAITVAGWFRLDASQQSAMIARYDTAANRRVWALFFNPVAVDGYNSVEWVISPNGSNPDQSTRAKIYGQSITDGQWRHFAGTWKAGEKAKLYIDGAMATEASEAQSAMYQTDTAMTVGRFANNAYQMRGASDDVRIYDRALSSNDVSRIYQGGQPRPKRQTKEAP